MGLGRQPVARRAIFPSAPEDVPMTPKVAYSPGEIVGGTCWSAIGCCIHVAPITPPDGELDRDPPQPGDPSVSEQHHLTS